MMKYILLIAILFAVCFAETTDIDTSSCTCSHGETATSEVCVPPVDGSEPQCTFGNKKRDNIEEVKSTEGTTKLGRNQARNLIVNGGFEHAWLHWNFYSFVPGSFWAPQHGNSFFSENGLPAPPEGETAMMNAAATGFSLVGMYQTFTWSDYANCAFVKFDVSFQYFLRNHLSFYDPGNLFSGDIATQVFRVDILDTRFRQLHNIYITEVGTPATTGTYKTHKGSFYITTAANTFNADFLRLRFGVRALHHLRVGVDDVKVHATCLNFPAQPVQFEHHDDYHHDQSHKEVIQEFQVEKKEAKTENKLTVQTQTQQKEEEDK